MKIYVIIPVLPLVIVVVNQDVLQSVKIVVKQVVQQVVCKDVQIFVLNHALHIA